MNKLPFPCVGREELEFYIWNTCEIDDLFHGEEVLLRFRGSAKEFKGVWDSEEGVFHVGEGTVNIAEVKWRKSYPVCVIMRAAINYLNLLGTDTNATQAE